MIEFDFGSYNDIKNAINQANIMKYTLIGGQAVACTWVIVKFINAFVKDTFEGQEKKTNMIEMISLLVFVIIAPYAMDILDDTFSSVEGYVQDFKGAKLPTSLKESLTATLTGVGNDSNGVWSIIVGILDISLSDLMLAFFNLLLGFVGFILWAIDCAIFAIFYTERLILIELYRFLFPLFVAFIGFEGLRQKYWKWVTGYIALLLLPIPYIAVHNAVDAITHMIINKNKSELQAINCLIIIITMLASIGMKYKILSTIGNSLRKILS